MSKTHDLPHAIDKAIFKLMGECHADGLRHQEVATKKSLASRDKLRAAIADFAASAQVDEPLTRFCPGCGSVGPVPEKYRDCCPDGSRARMIPEPLANHCRDLFLVALGGARAQQIERSDEDDQYTIDRAADLLEHYVDFIKEVKPDDIERHPYLPEIEMVAQDLRAMATQQSYPATGPIVMLDDQQVGDASDGCGEGPAGEGDV